MEKTSWLTTHLEGFVKPYLGFIPKVEKNAPKYFTPEEMAVIKNLWRSAKRAAGKNLLVLPGRDVFIFEVLAKREKYPTLFLPACSRGTVRKFIGQIPLVNAFIFDTGFVGSIPLALGVKNFKLASYSRNKIIRVDTKQVFPRLTLSRHLALKIEGTAKYWQTGRLVEGNIIQEKSNPEEFERAAKLTIEIYRDSSPGFINKMKPLGGGLSWKTKKYDELWTW